MKKLKEQRGITLIALIITIIVMLILVAVTVTVALNGGLFKTAKQATSETDLEKEKELLLEVVMGAIGKNGKVNFEELRYNDMFAQDEENQPRVENGNLVVTIAKSGRKYEITPRGTIKLVDNEGGGEAPPVEGEEPEEPSNPETRAAGLYSEDGILTISWEELTTGDSPIIPLSDDGQTITQVSSTNRATLSGKLIIPNEVININKSAFLSCTGLTKVSIPNSVTSIGDYPFRGCTSLTGINVEESNPNYSSDNGVVYNKDKTTLLQYPAGKTESSFTILNTVTNIADYAFYKCSSLTSLTIPESVTGIGKYAFSATGLTQVNIPNSISSISNYAFSSCKGLISVSIGNGVSSIGIKAFSSCTDLTEVNIPESVTSIGSGAFSSCKKLTAKILGSNVTVKSSAFSNVPTVYYAGYVEGEDYSSWGATEVLPMGEAGLYADDGTFTSWDDLVNSGNVTVTEGVLTYFNGMGKLVIDNSVTIIEEQAFANCTGLTEVSIPNSVIEIGYQAFEYCSNLTSVEIGSGVALIYDGAFKECPNLTEINIPSCVTYIGGAAFGNCTSLTAIILGSNVEVGSGAFEYVPTVYYAGYVEGTDYSSWGAGQVSPLQ